MGQAKRRGTFEERKAQAIERESHKRIIRAHRKADAPTGRRGMGRLAMLMALMASSRGRR